MPPKHSVKENTNIPEWSWACPDLSIDSLFYNSRVHTLRHAVNTLSSDYAHLFNDGLHRLKLHRDNYGPNGPQHLVILWWEWPKEHWTELRDGASMNFMTPPVPGLVPNQNLEGPALVEAIKFVDQLVSLGVLREAQPSDNIINNFPLFLVPKPGQPDEFRCIADGKTGGQNDACVADPCQMTSPDHILPLLYNGGWSATLDISKYFHMFPTKREEKAYFGLIHPGTGKMHVYDGFPMGTRNSPGASGRFGAAFTRMIIDSSDLFQGEPVDNSIQQYFVHQPLHPTYSDGRVLIGNDGLPTVILKMHVDDIFIHGPTRTKLISALNYVLDQTVRLGLICQAAKTTSPSQSVKFCGFIYDTVSVPTLCIPGDKVSRAIAMVEFLLHGFQLTFSRLVLSMVVGFLQSLTPATPGNIGAAFLRPLYDDLHNLPDVQSPNTKQAYFCKVSLTSRSQHCLQWWVNALTCGLSKQSRPTQVGTIGVTWGDGSGTGFGGSFNMASSQPSCTDPSLEIWMDTWTPQVAGFSSNWKEMRTLLRTLENELASGSKRVYHRILVYFADNMVTYDIFRRGSSKSTPLWILLLHIKLLELKLKCHLIVIHIPGDTMILQGTDGLSRGVPMQPMGSHRGNDLVALLWRPAPPSYTLLNWVLTTLVAGPIWPPPTLWIIQHDYSNWSRSDMFNRFVFWCVSPGFARQAILQALYIWVEAPATCGHIFLVPRLLQRDFGRVSKFVLFGGQHTNIPLPFIPLVPFLIYYIPPFNRRAAHAHALSRSEARVDTPSDPVPIWIRQEIEDLLRVSVTN